MHRMLAVAATMVVLTFAGCLDDDAAETDRTSEVPDEYVSEWDASMLPDPVTDFHLVGTPDQDNARGVWLDQGKAYLSGTEGMRIYDIRDPNEPVLLAAEIEGTENTRDVDIMHHPDGRVYAVLAHGGSQMSFVDVTDPARATVVSTVTELGPSHNIAVVPNSTLVYNSRSISQHVPIPGTTGQMDLVDFADPANPVVSVWAFPIVAMDAAGIPKPVLATTCHDVTFVIDSAKQWAFCAGVTETHIWDIADPYNPVIIQVIHAPLNNIHHGAWGARGGDILIIGDEFAGAIAGPVCTDPIPNPYAALWFWDISDLALPMPVGYFQIPYNSVLEVDTGLCTTHFGNLVEDADLFILGQYTGGVSLIDFSDASNPVGIAHFRPEGDMSVWDARYYEGHVYTGDSIRGMDVLRLV